MQTRVRTKSWALRGCRCRALLWRLLVWLRALLSLELLSLVVPLLPCAGTFLRAAACPFGMGYGAAAARADGPNRGERVRLSSHCGPELHDFKNLVMVV